MAESISELYFRLGLDASGLTSGFVDAEQSLSQNLRRLNNRENLIQLKTQIQLEGLDQAALGTDGLRIKQEALNQQLEIQADRINMTEAAYQTMVQTQGENSEAAFNLSMMLEQERVVLYRLQQQTQALADQQRVALGVNWELIGAIEPTVKMIDIAAAGATSLRFLGRAIPIPQVKLAAAALLGLSAVVTGTIDATEELENENAAEIFAEDAQNASVQYRNALEPMRADVIRTADVIDKSFSSASASVNKSVQEQKNSFTDWARDIFRISFLFFNTSDTFIDAISKVNAQSQFMRTELGEYAVVATGLYTSFNGLTNSALAFVEKPIDDFKKLKLQANELNLSLYDTQKLLSLIDLSGADYNDIRDYVRGVQDAVIKGDSEDPEVIAITKYGVAIQDANGKLLPFNETLQNLYEGFLRAKEAGEEEAFVIMTNGQAVQDVLPFFNELAKAKIKFSEISWSTSDFAALEQTAADMKLMQVQADEFNNALHSLGLPIADWAAQSKFETYKKLTDLIEENRETILKWEFVFIGALENISDKAATALGKVKNTFNDVWQDIKDKFKSDPPEEDEGPSYFEKVLANWKTLKNPYYNESTNRMLYQEIIAKHPELNPGGLTEDEFVNRTKIQPVSGYVVERIVKYIKETLSECEDYIQEYYEEVLSNAEQDLEEYISANERAREETEKTAEEISNGLSYSYNRIAKYKEELADIKIDLQFDDDEYQKSLARLDLWYQKAMQDAKYYQAEQATLNDLRQAKQEQIERDNNKKIQEAEDESRKRTENLRREAANIDFGLNKSPFEQQINHIKQWEQAALESLDKYKDSIRDKGLLEQEAAAIAANALAKEREAFEREMDRIKGKTQDLREKIFEQENSQRDIDIMRVQKQVAEMQKEGIYNADVINRWKENEYAKIAKKAVENPDYSKKPHLGRDNGGLGIFYGDQIDDGFRNIINPNKNFWDDIQQQSSKDVADKFGILSETTTELSNAQEELKKAIEIIHGDELAQSYIDSINRITEAQDSFAETVTEEGDTLAQALRDTAEKIGNVQISPAFKQPENDGILTRENGKIAADAIDSIGQAMGVAGAGLSVAALYGSTVNPLIGAGLAAGGGLLSFLGDGVSKYLENTEDDSSPNVYTPNVETTDITAAIKDAQNALSKDIGALTKATSAIGQHVEQIASRENVVNVSPTINIDLGGAYVFDDAMKEKLTNDISDNVTNAVKDAFNRGVRSASYGFGN